MRKNFIRPVPSILLVTLALAVCLPALARGQSYYYYGNEFTNESVQSTSAACDAATKGAIRYNGATSSFEACNGTAWGPLTGAAAAGSTAQIQFNSGGSFGASANFVFTSAGNLGVGTASPGALLDLGNASTELGTLRLENSNAGGYYVQLQPSTSATASVIYTLPTTPGTGGQVLSTDGTGVLSWATPSGGGPWSGLTNPTANLGLTMGAYTSTFTYNNATGSSNMFALTDTANNSGTGAILFVSTASGSHAAPLRVSTQAGAGNLVFTSAGRLGIGTSSPGELLFVSGGNLVARGNYNSGPLLAESGSGARMIWYPRKAAFRAGYAAGTQWDDSNIGADSAALESGTASGFYSTAWGESGYASAENTTAWGAATASDYGATAWGNLTTASGMNSTAWGESSKATAENATAWGTGWAYGFGSTAWGIGEVDATSTLYGTAWGQGWVTADYGTAWGYGTASGNNSTAWGYSTASGQYSTAWGQYITAAGTASTALGQYVMAGDTADTNGMYSMAIGLTNTSTTPYAKVTGTGSMGIFMQDQHSDNISGDNIMALMGGDLYIDPTTGGGLTVSSALEALDVHGRIHMAQGTAPGTTTDRLYNVGGTLYWNGTALGGGGSQTPWTSNINAAGYTLDGNSTASGNLTLDSTSNATKGYVLLNPTAGNVGIGNSAPGALLDIGSNGSTVGTMRLENSVSGDYVQIQPSTSATANVTYTLPINAGTSGQVLSTDGTGVLSWATPSGGGGGPTGSDTQIAFNDAGTESGSSALIWDYTNTALTVTGDINYSGIITDTSDIRLKKDIRPLSASGDMLDKLTKVDTYSYIRKNNSNNRVEYGVIAQQLKTVFPDLVHTAKDDKHTESVDYTGLIPPLIESVKQLKAQNDDLKTRLATAESKLNSLESDMKGMKTYTGYGTRRAGFGEGAITGMLALLGLMFAGRALRSRRMNTRG